MFTTFILSLFMCSEKIDVSQFSLVGETFKIYTYNDGITIAKQQGKKLVTFFEKEPYNLNLGENYIYAKYEKPTPIGFSKGYTVSFWDKKWNQMTVESEVKDTQNIKLVNENAPIVNFSIPPPCPINKV